MRVAQQFIIGTPFILLNAQEGVGIVLQRNEFILIELLLFHIIKSHNMLVAKVLGQRLPKICSNLFYVGGATSKITEHVAHL